MFLVLNRLIVVKKEKKKKERTTTTKNKHKQVLKTNIPNKTLERKYRTNPKRINQRYIKCENESKKQ